MESENDNEKLKRNKKENEPERKDGREGEEGNKNPQCSILSFLWLSEGFDCLDCILFAWEKALSR